MVVQYTHQFYSLAASTISPNIIDKDNQEIVPENICLVARAEMLAKVLIEKGFQLCHPRLRHAAKVLYPFYIKVEEVQKEFIATSDISDVFESGETRSQAIINCLDALVDELVWYQNNKESLSGPLLRDYNKLRAYLGLI